MKKEKSLYDSDGRWVEEKTRIKGAIRRVFRLSPQMKEAMMAARVELPPALKKDGMPGKKNQVRYRCATCQGLFSQKNVQVDHLVPVVPLWKKESSMTVDEIARGIFCKVSNLQVMCSTPLKLNNGNMSCHRIKTNEENFIRDRLLKISGIDGYDQKRIDDLIEESKELYISHLKMKDVEKREKLERKLAREVKKRTRNT